MKNFIFGAIAVIGFFILAVSMASVEQDAISVLQGIVGFGVGFLMMFLPCHLGGFMSYQEPRRIIHRRKKDLGRSKNRSRRIA